MTERETLEEMKKIQESVDECVDEKEKEKEKEGKGGEEVDIHRGRQGPGQGQVGCDWLVPCGS